jgi:hypothetical protein
MVQFKRAAPRYCRNQHCHGIVGIPFFAIFATLLELCIAKGIAVVAIRRKHMGDRGHRRGDKDDQNLPDTAGDTSPGVAKRCTS